MECENLHSSLNPRKYIKIILTVLEFYREIKLYELSYSRCLPLCVTTLSRKLLKSCFREPWWFIICHISLNIVSYQILLLGVGFFLSSCLTD